MDMLYTGVILMYWWNRSLMEYVPDDGTLVPKRVGLNEVFIVCQVGFIHVLNNA